MKSSLLRLFYHFYQVRRKRRHGHGYHPLQTDNHTTVSRTFHLYKHPLVALEVTTRNTDFRTFTQVHLIGTEEDKMLVIRSSHSDKLPHLIIGHNDFLPVADINHILKIRKFELHLLKFGLDGMNKYQITDNGNQLTPLAPVPYTNLVTHGNEIVDSFFIQQSLDLHPPAISGTHGKPLHFFT